MARPNNLDRVLIALAETPGKKLPWTAVAEMLGWNESETKAWLMQMRLEGYLSVGKTTWQVTKKRKKRDQVAVQLELPFQIATNEVEPSPSSITEVQGV